MEQFGISSQFLQLLGVFIAVPLLLNVAWNLWLTYVYTTFLRSIKWTMLEVKPPRDVFKSPAAMELMMNSLHQPGGVGNWYDRYWKGQLRMFFSLEIVSIEGSIHFYIRTPSKFRKLIESQIYAQYPQSEVREVPDYVNIFPEYQKEIFNLWACTFKLEKDDPFPIKTYIDYGLDKAVGSLEEEERIDPITSMLEYMGSMGIGEHVWFQILVRSDTKRFTVTEKKNGKETVEKNKGWKDKAKELANKLREELRPPKKEGEPVMIPINTKGQLAVIESLERSVTKLGFDCGMRALYIAKNENFDANKISGLSGMLKQYSNGEINSFKLNEKTGLEYPWQDLFKTKLDKMKKYMLHDYKHRNYFYGEFDSSKPINYFTNPNKSGKTPFILTTEELATIYHLPGRVAATPTFTRIEAKKAEPPANLPI